MSFQRPVDSFLPQQHRELLDLELYMARRVNEERGALGLRALACHALLAAVARAHSAEMRDLGYFAHESPTPRFATPGDRYEYAFGTRSRFLAENVSCRKWQSRCAPVSEDVPNSVVRACNRLRNRMAPPLSPLPLLLPTQGDVEESHLGLMRSPGHRANILEPTVDIMGIGIVNRGRNLWVTQMFAWRQ